MGYPENLQKICEQKGLGQAELAAGLGLSRSTLSRILRGVQEPKLTLAYELAKALGVSLDTLVEGGGAPGESPRSVILDDDEWTVLRIVRRLGTEAALDRLLGIDRHGFAAADDGVEEVRRKG